MISIVVSSYKEHFFQEFSQNVAETIGVPYEIIKIENQGKYGLCEAYNLGLSRATYDAVLFSHEDILFHTKNWGSGVIQQFEQNPSLGLMGLAGCAHKTNAPTPWYSDDGKQSKCLYYLNLTQSDYKGERPTTKTIVCPDNVTLGKVVTLDGCWLCTRKSVAEEIKFDQQTFTGYHCYDIDFSLSVAEKYEVAVYFGIDVEHKSHGDYSLSWLEDTIKLYHKWKDKLPMQAKEIPEATLRKAEYVGMSQTFVRAKVYGYPKMEIYKIAFDKNFRKAIGLKRWLRLQGSFIKTLLRRT
ncbi:MAG: glycosyltransferase [Edaphocola sp.]